eukprot:1155916-Pelagomonas_calceolata.AAC.3
MRAAAAHARDRSRPPCSIHPVQKRKNRGNGRMVQVYVSLHLLASITSTESGKALAPTAVCATREEWQGEAAGVGADLEVDPRTAFTGGSCISLGRGWAAICNVMLGGRVNGKGREDASCVKLWTSGTNTENLIEHLPVTSVRQGKGRRWERRREQENYVGRGKPPYINEGNTSDVCNARCRHELKKDTPHQPAKRLHALWTYSLTSKLERVPPKGGCSTWPPSTPHSSPTFPSCTVGDGKDKCPSLGCQGSSRGLIGKPVVCQGVVKRFVRRCQWSVWGCRRVC